jgi:hypothetical protein
MASKRIDELDARVVADDDLLPVTPSGGPSGKATVAAIVAEGLSQPNSASSGAGASITIKAADGVTSGAGGNIVLQPGAQATTGGNGTVRSLANFTLVNSSQEITFRNQNGSINLDTNYVGETCVLSNFRYTSVGNYLRLRGREASGGGSIVVQPNTVSISANQNDYALTSSGLHRLNCTVASDITGIAPAISHLDGRMIRLVNVGTATVTLKHDDAASAAANRIYMHGGNHTALTVNEWADLVYDSTDNGSGAAGWRLVKYA